MQLLTPIQTRKSRKRRPAASLSALRVNPKFTGNSKLRSVGKTTVKRRNSANKATAFQSNLQKQGKANSGNGVFRELGWRVGEVFCSSRLFCCCYYSRCGSHTPVCLFFFPGPEHRPAGPHVTRGPVLFFLPFFPPFFSLSPVVWILLQSFCGGSCGQSVQNAKA